MNRFEVAAAIEEIALLLDLKGENPFKAHAFEAAARTLRRSELPLELLAARGALTSVAGIGPSTAEQIASLLRTGVSPLLEELRGLFPESLREILQLPGLGAKRLRAIHESLGVTSLSELEYAIHENHLRDLPGFGSKRQESLLAAIESLRARQDRFLLPEAWRAAEEMLAPLCSTSPRVEIGGSLRRQIEIHREVLLLREGSPAGEELRRAGNGVPVRLLTRPSDAFDACWLWESCSSEHRASLVERARSRGLVFGEEGLFRDSTRLTLDEAGIYRALGLAPIHPLLREGPAEDAPDLRHLAGPETIRGIFHVHTTASDGSGSLEEMALEALRLGYSWMGVSDHSRTAIYANGLSPERLRAQRAEILALRPRLPQIRIFHGVESDILGDGSLDYDEGLLAELDFVVASVHSQLRMPREAMTRRIERALRHPATTHWGHPTGRILLGRDGYACDIPHLLRVCAEEGVSVEFNANPHRLDLDWSRLADARALGVPVSINPDAHAPAGLADARLTVGTAAKGALTETGILNSRAPEEIARWLVERKG